MRRALVERSDLRRSLARASGLRAAVAVPANAHGAQRLVTLDAFRRAGFEVTAMLNEPSAAGFEYTHRHRDTLSSRRDLVVVYDLGGGTFDASVVRMSGRLHEVLATAGIGRLGGDDFDGVVADLVLGHAGVARAALPGRALDRLLDQCRAAKEALVPSSRKLTVDLEAVLGGDAPRAEVTVPVAEFYEACTPLVERTIDAMVPLMSRADGAATEPDLSEIAGVYVVGGASELPIVARALRERFGRRVHRSPYPSAAVAIGLSIAADGTAAFELVDRYARTFGVFREGAGRARDHLRPHLHALGHAPLGGGRPRHLDPHLPRRAQPRPLPLLRVLRRRRRGAPARRHGPLRRRLLPVRLGAARRG